MRYKFALICIILVAFVIPGRGDQVIADGVILTSLVRVLAHPEKYQGKQIELIGYL